MRKSSWTRRDPIKNYFPLPNEIYSLGLSAGAIAVYGFLMRIENRQTYQCTASYRTIGHATGMSVNTVRKYVAELEERGLIITERTTVTTRDGRILNGCLRYTIWSEDPRQGFLTEQGIEKLIFRNPADSCKLPPAKSREMKVLTPEEIQRLLIQAKEDGCYELLLLDLATGLRRGEILALQWDDLNFRTGALRVERQVHRVKGELVISPPKTKAGNRTILLPTPVLKVLKAYQKTVHSCWMFPSPVKEDSPMDPAAVRKRLQTVLERAECKRLRFHDLRHTFATASLEHGMDIKTLSTIIGHVSSTTTLNTYTHVTDAMRQSAADKIDRGIGRAEPKPRQESAPQKPAPSTFQAHKGQRRKPGTGCVGRINDHLWEGRYSPIVNGKRVARNVYAKTEAECEEKLATLIQEMKAEITAIKNRMKQENIAG